MEIEKMSPIQKRQHYYFKGRGLAESGQTIEAIEVYKIYCTVLAKEDQHIPELWISKMYKEIGNEIESLKHLERYAIGCSDPKAAEVYKDCGDGYSNLGQFDMAIANYKLALKKNPKSPVKSKLQALQK